ncbi:MAG: type I restriction endonuclease subunit R [Mycoplasmatota bacterium]
MNELKTIAESKNFIVLDQYKKIEQSNNFYQSEASLEKEFITDLSNQGYEYLTNVTSTESMLRNIRIELSRLNSCAFNDREWERFCLEYLDKPADNHIDRIRKIQEDYVYDFVFDDGHIENIYLVNKKDILKNKLQVISQFEQKGSSLNRYDVTILVNGLPLIHVELKKRGVAIKEAFNQIHRYSKESFNSENSLYKYLQIFVISNGTDSRYFANTTKRDKNSYDFTMNWANSKNELIKDLKDFTATFFEKNTILKILLNYSVFDTSNNLLIMRPYQIAATERILWKIKSSYNLKKWKSVDGGGYIWHTTGSGKTLTSFKAARLATELDFIDKVFFVVDRKDLDYQTMKEYQRFSPDSVNGSENTAGLKRNIEKDDNKIIVTTIQKLNNFMKTEQSHPVYEKQVLFIFDEAHRSQFGEAQKNIYKKFKKYYQFGFTGTPIFPENALGSETTASVFGNELHSYVITDAIRDEKVLKFKVDYNNVNPVFKGLETEKDMNKLSSFETKQALLHPERIKEISEYILKNFNFKTNRKFIGTKGFNAMFAVSSVDAAKLYYECFKNLQKDLERPLKIATIFSFAANEEQNAVGEILEETFEPIAMDSSAKEFLTSAINDYNKMFKTNFCVDSKEFQNYYRDLASRVKNQEVDLIIVVGMFLTGFDAPTLNTLFVDKNLRYHGLMQAFSRTNRIYDSTKTFGNIVAFRDLEQATIDSIKCFGDSNTRDVVLEKSYKEYIEGFKDISTGEAKRGYIDIVNELNNRFSNIDNILTEKDKKSFVKLFGEYLKVENILQNYDEFMYLKEFQKINKDDINSIEKFKSNYYLEYNDIENMSDIPVIKERTIQDYRSVYNDIREWLRREKETEQKEDSSIDWNDVVFEIDLLKSQEINLDYILELIFEKNKLIKDKNILVQEARRLIRSSVGNRAKESLIVDFINDTNLDEIADKYNLIDEFFKYAQTEQLKEVELLIKEEELNIEATKRYITNSLKREYASENGTELNEVLPKMSPLNPNYLTKKQTVFQKIVAFVDKFKGVGGKL